MELRIDSLEVVDSDIHGRLPIQRPHENEQLMIPLRQTLEIQQPRCYTT